MNHTLTQAQRTLVTRHLSLVAVLARRTFHELRGRLQLHDLEGHGVDGLVEAALRYDEARGATFTTFATYRIRGAMLDAIRRTIRETTFAEPVADEWVSSALPPADDLAVRRQALSRLAGAVAMLPVKERHFISRVYADGRDITTAGAELGLSKSWSSRIHARSIRQLRAALGLNR